MRLKLFSAALLLALAGCGQSAGLRTDDAGLGGAAGFAERPAPCAAEAFQILIGQPAGEIHLESLPHPVRVTSVAAMEDADVDPARLTLLSGANGRVAEVVCG